MLLAVVAECRTRLEMYTIAQQRAQQGHASATAAPAAAAGSGDGPTEAEQVRVGLLNSSSCRGLAVCHLCGVGSALCLDLNCTRLCPAAPPSRCCPICSRLDGSGGCGRCRWKWPRQRLEPRCPWLQSGARCAAAWLAAGAQRSWCACACFACSKMMHSVAPNASPSWLPACCVYR